MTLHFETLSYNTVHLNQLIKHVCSRLDPIATTLFWFTIHLRLLPPLTSVYYRLPNLQLIRLPNITFGVLPKITLVYLSLHQFTYDYLGLHQFYLVYLQLP